ncbi:hypothetical protein PR003_g6208 [Phytophthora rubi]|uniref:Secreted protein n=1 Tax=Phytophthora rubi TaxID=129364 RepID=A0A6A3NID4_9STRA|nr:hypothetical protein PR001_g5852 [Phytophthora rubi]KAE9348846.1 hypothetical protein PR003_g6208 [Phytophthora rubi]
MYTQNNTRHHCLLLVACWYSYSQPTTLWPPNSNYSCHCDCQRQTHYHFHNKAFLRVCSR